MPTFLTRYAPQTFALMRIVSGFLFLWHGSQKLLGIPAAAQQAPAFIKYAGGSIELFGGILVAVGLFAGWAAFICSGEMAVAYGFAHAAKAVLPLQNGGELSVLYCFVFLCIAAHGAGVWSLDAAGKRA